MSPHDAKHDNGATGRVCDDLCGIVHIAPNHAAKLRGIARSIAGSNEWRPEGREGEQRGCDIRKLEELIFNALLNQGI